MNAIQEISLKLQMGIDPSVEIDPAMLRAMWNHLVDERSRAVRRAHPQVEDLPARLRHPGIQKSA